MILTPLFVIFLVLVFALTWTFTNTIDKRKWVSLLIAIILTPVIYFYVFYPVINIFSSYHHKKYFDEIVWKDKPALRYEMSDHIIDEHLFLNKSKDDVETRLGKSEWLGWDDTLKKNSSDKWNYNLGFKPGAFNNMQECIEIEFKNNLVVNIRQYQLEKTFE